MSGIVIRRVETESERARAERFINTKYQQLFGTIPPCSEVLVCAYRGGEVVGTMGIDIGQSGQQLRLMRLYPAEPQNLPVPATKDNSIEFGRWIATTPGVSASLSLAAVRTGRLFGKRYGWCEHTDAVHTVARRLGVAFYPVPARLALDAVEPHNRTFYLTRAAMSPYLTDLVQMEKSLAAVVAPLLSTRSLSFD